MKTIVEQAKIIKNIIGYQTVDINIKYRLLTFCYAVKCNDGYLLYNDLTKELLLLNIQETKIIQDKKFFTEDPFVLNLIEKWFLVPIDNDDFKLSKQILSFAKLISIKPGLKFCNIFPTTACNARCFYCFEAGVKPKNMTVATATAVADYIIKNCVDNKIKLQWFGGEPLCNIKAIDTICERLRANNIKFSSVIITNGYLLTEENVKKAKNDWNTNFIQITLDGMEETYNRVKNYKNPVKSAFKQVINNMKCIIKSGIDINVRLNMDFYNEKELYDLTDYLYKLFGSYEKFKIYTSLIYEDVGFSPTKHTDYDRNILFDKYFEFIKYQDKLNLVRTKLLDKEIRLGRCSADSLNSVQISPEGKLGNCEHYPDSHFYGSVFTEEPREIWTDYAERLDICKTCAIYPSCFILKRCNTSQCSDFRKKKQLDELRRNIIYTYEASKEKTNNIS